MKQPRSFRLAGVVTALAALAALGVAYYVQDFMLLFPCPLCLLERWPYRLVILLGILAAISPRTLARIVLCLAVLTLLAGAAIAFIHVGVEYHWWQSPLPECNGILTPRAPLPMTPAKPCDTPTFLIPALPVSMAAMDLLYAVIFASVLFTYLLRTPRRVS
jgi:disulfide bond formation protein DsbB